MQDKTKITKESLDALIAQWNNSANANKQISKIDDLMNAQINKLLISAALMNQTLYNDLHLLSKYIADNHQRFKIDNLEEILKNLNEIKQQELEKLQLIQIQDDESKSEEDPNLKKLKILCRRLYSTVDGKKQIEFTGTPKERQEKKFLAHALLTNILYNIPQECNIHYQSMNCILDGESDYNMSIDGLLDCFKDRKTHPFTHLLFKEETLYYINCIKPGFNLGQARDTFKADEFAKYEVAYAKAQLILADKIIIWNDRIEPFLQDYYNIIKLLLQDYKFNLENNKRMSCIITIVQNSDSAKEINDLLKPYASSNPFIIKKLIDSEAYQAKLADAIKDPGILENFRNFVCKCLLVIAHCVKFCFTTESPSQRYNDYKSDCTKYTESHAIKDFRDLIITSWIKQSNTEL